jgi:hypothetical protein
MEPPPPPPLPPPPPDHMPAASAISNSRLYTIIAWVVAPPIGSFVMLFVAGKADPDARFNAANATAVHGVMLAGYIVLQVLAAAVWVLYFLLWIWWAIWVVVWVLGLVLAIQSEGRRFRFPVLTDTLAGLVTTLEGLAQ